MTFQNHSYRSLNSFNMKKSFFETTVGKILIGIGKIVLGSVLKKQKFNKVPKDEKNIDDLIDKI